MSKKEYIDELKKRIENDKIEKFYLLSKESTLLSDNEVKQKKIYHNIYYILRRSYKEWEHYKKMFGRVYVKNDVLLYIIQSTNINDNITN